jgi:hypothetical protein
MPGYDILRTVTSGRHDSGRRQKDTSPGNGTRRMTMMAANARLL